MFVHSISWMRLCIMFIFGYDYGYVVSSADELTPTTTSSCRRNIASRECYSLYSLVVTSRYDVLSENTLLATFVITNFEKNTTKNFLRGVILCCSVILQEIRNCIIALHVCILIGFRRIILLSCMFPLSLTELSVESALCQISHVV